MWRLRRLLFFYTSASSVHNFMNMFLSYFVCSWNMNKPKIVKISIAKKRSKFGRLYSNTAYNLFNKYAILQEIHVQQVLCRLRYRFFFMFLNCTNSHRRPSRSFEKSDSETLLSSRHFVWKCHYDIIKFMSNKALNKEFWFLCSHSSFTLRKERKGV